MSGSSPGSKRNRLSVFQPEFREDLRFWVENDRRVALRALDIVEAILRDPFVGIGKPEPLRHLRGAWSRRLTQEHRIVYVVTDDRIDFLQARPLLVACNDGSGCRWRRDRRHGLGAPTQA